MFIPKARAGEYVHCQARSVLINQVAPLQPSRLPGLGCLQISPHPLLFCRHAFNVPKVEGHDQLHRAAVLGQSPVSMHLLQSCM